MKKYYIVRYESDTPDNIKYEKQSDAITVAEQAARAMPGREVAVFQIKQLFKVDTTPVVEVTLEN